MKEKTKDPYKLRAGKVLGWSGRAVSIAINVIILGYVTFFCTNIMGLDTKTTGFVLLASKVFDGVTDIFAGFLVDRTNTKWGKARPYEFSILGVWIGTILLFSCPQLGDTAKYIWVFVTYTCINSIFVTFLNASEPVYLRRAFKYESDRSKLVSINGIIVMLSATAISIIFPILMGTLGTSAGGWRTMILIIAIPMMLIGMCRFLFVQEVNVDDDTSAAQKLEFKDMAPVFKNKYIYLTIGTTIAIGLITNIISAVQTYYFTYIVGDVTKMSTLGMLGLITPFLLIFMPKLMTKLSLRSMFVASAVIGVCGSFLRGIAGGNIGILMAASLVQTIAALVPSYYTVLLLIDIMDYNEWKNGKRVEGVISAANGFAGKVASGLASAFVGIYMGMFDFDGTAAVQTEAAINSIVQLYCWIPMVLYIIVAILMFFFDLGKYMPQVKKDLGRDA